MTSGIRKPPPISTSSPRDTITDRPWASAASTSSTAAAPLLTTRAASAPAALASSEAARPVRHSPRLRRVAGRHGRSTSVAVLGQAVALQYRFNRVPQAVAVFALVAIVLPVVVAGTSLGAYLFLPLLTPTLPEPNPGVDASRITHI